MTHPPFAPHPQVMVLKDGGPCIGMIHEKAKNGEERPPPRQCSKTRDHAWYSGPLCKACYEKEVREKGGRRGQGKRARVEEVEERGGDYPVEIVRINGARYVPACPHEPGDL